VLKEMIFPNCEKLGQTMIFVRTKETSRALHGQMQNWGYKITSIQVRGWLHACYLYGRVGVGPQQMHACLCGMHNACCRTYCSLLLHFAAVTLCLSAGRHAV
jgi:hypothetical protein